MVKHFFNEYQFQKKEIDDNRIMKNKVLLLFALLIGLSCSQCLTQACMMRNPPTILNLLNPTMITDALEQEIRRQFWYYLRNAVLIDTNVKNTQLRLVVYFYHQNNVGTFLTIASYFYRLRISQINTIVRIGNGLPSSRDGQFVIGPKILLQDDQQWILDLEVHDQSILSYNPNTQNLTVIHTAALRQEDCLSLSDQYLRSFFSPDHDQVELLMDRKIEKKGEKYQILTYRNYTGTYMGITSCIGKNVVIKTFVRLGNGKTLIERQQIQHTVRLNPSVLTDFAEL